VSIAASHGRTGDVRPSPADPSARPRPTPSGSDLGLSLRGLTKRLGGRDVVAAMDLDVRSGELVCLLGPSGCGKTTTLRMIGGFLAPDAGDVVIAGRRHTTTPPERRPTAMVFQNYALWPHMTVSANVAFGLRMRRLPKAQIREQVEQVLELVGLTHHLNSMPGRISGGEQQRVALARALVLRPSLLLLDEPLSNLDAKLRVRVREDIREIQQRVGITTVLVTHDQEEALALADRIAVMNDGRIEQYAAPNDVYRYPASPFVAGFVGTVNLLDARIEPDADAVALRLAPGLAVPCTDAAIRDAAPARGPAGPVTAGIRPEDVVLTAPGSWPGPGAAARGRVVRDVPLGHYREVVVDLGPVRLRAFVAPDRRLDDEVDVGIARVVTYPPPAGHDLEDDA
jgi:ABC-type Fe3+/spermidine/putrescine transport system ATPase subunit